jgi:hypothetical protein
MSLIKNPKQYLGVFAKNPPDTTIAQRDPTGTDIQYRLFTEWLNETTTAVWILTGFSAGAAVWQLMAAGSESPAGVFSTVTATTTIHAGTILSAGTAVTAATTVTAGTGITATTGAITATSGNLVATNGNLVFGTSGNKISTPYASNTATAGANSFGTVTLSSGTVTVATTAITAASMVFLTRQSTNSSTALGILCIGTRSAGVNFVINACTIGTPGTPVSADNSIVAWMIVN